MDFNQIVVCILLVLVFVAFIKEWFSPDLVAMGAFVLLLAIGVLDEKSALAVFSNPAPIIVSCMFVLSATGTVGAKPPSGNLQGQDQSLARRTHKKALQGCCSQP